ncbi:MAG: hypothetical protein ACP5P4_02735 [Steroidobacteraceae bacterium]
MCTATGAHTEFVMNSGEWIVGKFNAGIWIDHRAALMVFVSAAEERTTHFVSKVQTQWRRAGDSPMKGRYASDQVPADDRRQKALTAELNIYYDALIAALRNAESFVIFGPGEAKKELKKRVGKSKLAARLRAVETADKMTDRQIAAKVRKYFADEGATQRTR